MRKINKKLLSAVLSVSVTATSVLMNYREVIAEDKEISVKLPDEVIAYSEITESSESAETTADFENPPE